jgi:histidyl-tRNA synthetase
MTAQTLKGFRDFLPRDVRKRNYVLNTLKGVFDSYGFEPLETPVLEYEEVLTGKYGEEGDKLMYKFEDNGGRRVAMRYDQTVPLARVIAQYSNDIPLPFKRYQIQNVYRAENTQRGRYREFLQVDADTIGSSSPLADAEIIAMTITAYKKLGFNDFKVLINDREVLKVQQAELGPWVKEGMGPKELAEMDLIVARAVDKIDKIGEERVISEISEKTPYNKEQAREWLYVLKKKDSTPHIKAIFEELEKAHVDRKHYEFYPILARGLDYYTQTIFEVITPEYPGSLGGGGRYDKLIGMFAEKQVSAVGFAFGFDRTLEVMDILNLFPNDLGGTELLVTNTNEKALETANEIRNKGIRTELYIDDKDLDKQLKYADKKGIPFVLLFEGENLILKNMTNGIKKEVNLENLSHELS